MRKYQPIYSKLTRWIEEFDLNNQITPNHDDCDIVNCFNKGNTKIYYVDWDDVDVDNVKWNDIRQNTLIIADGGNIYIDDNVYWDGLVWLISLRDLEDDERDDSGNIFVDTEVTNINALMYADWGLISTDWNEYGDELTRDELKNQLFIEGVLWTFNTLGGSNVPSCPHFVEECTPGIARYYDMEYVRDFQLVSASVSYDDDEAGDRWIPYGSGKLAWGVQYEYDEDKQEVAKVPDTCEDGLVCLLGEDDEAEFEGDGADDISIKDKLAPIYLRHDAQYISSNLPVFSNIAR